MYKKKYYVDRTYCPLGELERYEIKTYLDNNLVFQCFDDLESGGGFKRIIDNKIITIKNNKVQQYDKKLDNLNFIRVQNRKNYGND